MIYYLIITALTVSIDSFLCGFSFSLSKAKKGPLVLIISLTVFVMCLITNYAAVVFSKILNEKTVCLGGLILIAVGIYNLIKKNDELKNHKNFLIQSLTAGFAVGLDGAVANLSLAIMGINAFYVPITIAITHGLMIGLSVTLSELPFVKKLKKFYFIPPIILIILGLYKFIPIFF